MAWNGSGGKNTNSTSAAKRPVGVTKKRPSIMRGAFAALAVVVLAAGAWWWMTHLEPAPASHRKPTNDGTKQARTKSETKNAAREGAETEASPPKPIFPYDGKWRGHDIVSFGAETNETGYVVEKIVCDNGITYTHEFQLRKPPMFENETDNLLLQIAMREPGVETPPLPSLGNLDADFAKALTRPIIPLKDDPEDVKAKKRLVNSLRLNLKDTIESEGISVAEALMRDHATFNENVKLRNEAMAELREILRGGDEDGAQKYLETMNIAFRNLGIDELTMPEKVQRKRGE